ncbi:MAG: glutathione S-transferase N-terminal domain-containing protein [Bdellovibrio sp.]|nr:glutathione S-transferase N-terminal domain-containing protein [Bdellovibrio sp.]
MIDFYTAATPNGRKVAIMLEELQIPYTTHQVNLKEQEQKKPEFLAMNPNGRIPVIVDRANGRDTAVFESAAILYYLAEQNGGRFFGKTLEEKTSVMQWMMFQMSAVGPMFGNLYYGHHSMHPPVPQFVERFDKESHRVVGVLELQLSKHPYLAGNAYTIADMVTYPWVAIFLKSYPHLFTETPAVHRWAEAISQRPAVQKAMS